MQVLKNKTKEYNGTAMIALFLALIYNDDPVRYAVYMALHWQRLIECNFDNLREQSLRFTCLYPATLAFVK